MIRKPNFCQKSTQRPRTTQPGHPFSGLSVSCRRRDFLVGWKWSRHFMQTSLTASTISRAVTEAFSIMLGSISRLVSFVSGLSNNILKLNTFSTLNSEYYQFYTYYKSWYMCNSIFSLHSGGNLGCLFLPFFGCIGQAISGAERKFSGLADLQSHQRHLQWEDVFLQPHASCLRPNIFYPSKTFIIPLNVAGIETNAWY
jgi:hypothetical protein